MNTIQLSLAIIGTLIALLSFIYGARKVKSYIDTGIKSGADKAAEQAVENWKSVADSQRGRMDEMKYSIDDLTSQVKTLSDEKLELTQKVDKLQKTIESMTGVDGVGKMVEGAIEHFDGRMNEFMARQDTMIELLKNGKNVVNVNTK